MAIRDDNHELTGGLRVFSFVLAFLSFRILPIFPVIITLVRPNGGVPAAGSSALPRSAEDNPIK